jgi:hypothetical protein
MPAVHDFCGFLADLESLDEQRIIREAVRSAYPLKEEGSVIESVKEFLEDGVYRIFDGAMEGLPSLGLLCVLAARLLWDVWDTGHENRAVYRGPFGVFSYYSVPSPIYPVVRFWSLGPGGKVRQCRTPESFGRVSWTGGIYLFESACLVCRIGGVGVQDSTDIYGFADVYFLVSPNEEDLTAVKSAWVETCMMEECRG